MANSSSDRSTPSGVIFLPRDYLGFWKRLTVDVIDVGMALTALLATYLAVGIVLAMTIDEPSTFRALAGLTLIIALPLVWYCYFVLLRVWGFRTLGYKLCRAKLVSLQGQRLSWLALSLRVMFFVLGPANLMLDLVWMTSDETKQALRDKFTHAYVVSATAEPIGRGPLVYRSYDVMLWSLLFQEVSKVEIRQAR